MNQLHNLQHQFWNSLRNRQVGSACKQLFSIAGKLTPEKRLVIYRDTMRTAHINALAQTYTCCEKILGKRYFKKIASEYFYRFPATSQNINLYGYAFSQFIKDWMYNHAELYEYQYLADLAKLELVYEQAYYAKEDPCFDFDTFATLCETSQRQVCFKLSASLSVLKSDYPIHEIWLANQESGCHQEITAIDDPQYLCVAREDFRPVIHKIEQGYWWVLQNIQNNNSFAELETLEKQEDFYISPQTIIPELIKKKWICGYYLKHSSG